MTYRDKIILTYAPVSVSNLGAAVKGTVQNSYACWASVRRMSATKAMMTFQAADIVGVDVEFRNPQVGWNGMLWNGHALNYAAPDYVDNRSRIVKVQAYYQIDDPAITEDSVTGDTL